MNVTYSDVVNCRQPIGIYEKDGDDHGSCNCKTWKFMQSEATGITALSDYTGAPRIYWGGGTENNFENLHVSYLRSFLLIFIKIFRPK
jgi:hypothetical protein